MLRRSVSIDSLNNRRNLLLSNMVGPLMLLKMLHCKMKRSRKRRASNEDEETCLAGLSYDESSREIKMKKEDTHYGLFECRVCLKQASIPIFGDDDREDISEALSTFGGIEIQTDDTFSKHLCHSCHALLQGAILLRKTAKQTDKLSKPQKSHPKVKEEVIEENDVLTDSLDDTTFNYSERKVKRKVFSPPICKLCDIQFDSFKEYTEHRLSSEHENMRRTCPFCNKSYTALYYKKHLELHKSDAPYMCDVCGKKFIVKGHFTRHRQTHFFDLPFQCSLCPYRGRYTESLKMHMRTHTGEKPYQCSQCPSRFISKSNLNKHMLTHKNEHDFKCEMCGRGFYTKRTLELHFKVDHTGIRDHVCNVCGKAFGYRKQMMKHQLKVHKREKLRSGRMPLYLKVETMKQCGQDIAAET